MIRINLLPEGMEAQVAPINPVLPLVVAGLLPIVGAAIIHPIKAGQFSRLETEKTQKKQELEGYQAIVRQVQELEAARADLNNRKNVIKSLEVERLRYPQFMEDCVRMFPANVWITNLTTNLQGNSGAMRVTMNVVALDNYAIADLIANLENSQMFSEVDLGPITFADNAQTGGKQMTFGITAQYRKLEAPGDAGKKS